ncbi:IncP-type conjugal transfer protein TraG [Kordiimonas sp.]|uniref:IncP-type conjugal transfer protein TraG n=1 Tax=Kordiimonas sp. TaxID=1970157 RepID=UPI003A8C8C50
MTPTKFLLGQILIVFAVVFFSHAAATQWAAHMLGYQDALGSAWFYLGTMPLYLPWRLYEWWYAFDAYAPDVFERAGALAAAGGVLGVITAVVGSLWRARQGSHVTTYGSARWATYRDIIKAGLFEKAGVFLGRFDGSYLRHAGPEHVMAFAPTRSGKGVGLVVPTLLSWPGSVVVHDIKGENWELTAGYRARFSRTLYFNPTDETSVCFNPLLEVRRGASEVRDVQNIADILVDPEGSLERRNHWEKTSHSLLVGTILHILYAEETKTLAHVASFLSAPDRPFEATLRRMMKTPHLDGRPHPVVAEAARELLNKSENERSGVLSTAMSFLGLYRDPVVARVTAKSDFAIENLKGSRPQSLYLVVPPSDLSRTKPLMRLILNQIGRRLTETLPEQNTNPCLLMLDEFPALGRLDFFESALAYMAGYGIRAFLIAQSLNQIEKAYGPNNSILDNCHVRVAFASNDDRTAKRISDSLGTATELRAQKNYAGHRLAPWLAHVMVSRQETSRPLLTPGEVMQLADSDEIVMLAGCPPIRAQKLKYYEDVNFTSRVSSPPAREKASLTGSRAEDTPVPPQGSAPGCPPLSETVGDTWSGHVIAEADSEGGLSLSPVLGEGRERSPIEQAPDPLGLLDDDLDEVTIPQKGRNRTDGEDDKRLSALQRAHGVNQSVADDILPEL